MKTIRAKTACIFMFAVATQTAVAQSRDAQSSSFITVLGKDTLALEQYTRSANHVVGDWVTLYGGIMVHHYDIALSTDGSVQHAHLNLHRLNGDVEEDVDLTFTADSVVAVVAGDSSAVRAAAPGAFPTLGGIVAMQENIMMHLRLLKLDSGAVAVLSAAGPFRAGKTRVVFVKNDSAQMGSPAAPLLFAVDRVGHVNGVNRMATTTRSETRRVAEFNLAQVIKRFPDIPLDKPIVGFTAMSPRDTARATLGSTQILIDYGRPSLRGRNVFSHGVLGDTLWRTGANAATQITMSTDLTVGGKRVAAGTYTLWTHVSADNLAYELVFNSQTGQWGTEHHMERDVVSVPLIVRHVSSPVEKFSNRD